jgi:hypothetical protein
MDLSQALSNAVNNVVGPFWTFLFDLASLLAIGYMLSIGYRFAQSNKLPGQPSVSGGEVLAVIVISALLFQFGSAMNHASASLGFDAITYGAIDYPGAESFGKLAPAVNAALTVGSMAGGVYALRGFLMILRANTGGGKAGQDLGWRGFTHVFGGAAMANLVQVIEHLRQSTGGLW